MNTFHKYKDLIPYEMMVALRKEAQQLESLIGTTTDPWRLQVCSGKTKGNEFGGHHLLNDPMYKEVLSRHREDPYSQGALTYWYHAASPQHVDEVLGIESIISQATTLLLSSTNRARIENDLKVDLSDISSLSLKYTRFSPGAFLSPHTDNDVDKSFRASVILFLNKSWHPYYGGYLWVENSGNWEAISPTLGDAVCFPPSETTTHFVQMVNPVAPDARLAVSGWYVV